MILPASRSGAKYFLKFGKTYARYQSGCRKAPLDQNHVVVDHDHRHIGVCHGVEILLEPGGVAVGQVAESFGVGAGGQEQHVPAEDVDEGRYHGHINAGHVHAERAIANVGGVVLLEAADKLGVVLLAEGGHRVEAEDLLGVGEALLADRAEVDAAGLVGGVAHVGVIVAEILPAQQNAPVEALVPGEVEEEFAPLLDLEGASLVDVDSGDGLLELPMEVGGEFRSRHARRHFEVNGGPGIVVRHRVPLCISFLRVRTIPNAQ